MNGLMKRKFDERLRNNEDGAVVVVTALILTALLMFVALAADYGLYYLQSSRLQTAVDAAVMAAAAELPNEECAKLEAKRIMEENGFDLNVEDDMIFENNSTSVKIEKALEVKTTFAKVMKIHSMFTQKSAKAEYKNKKIPFQLDYALFSGSTTETLPMYGSLAVFGGPTHTNHALEEYEPYGSSTEFWDDYTYVNEPINCTTNTKVVPHAGSEQVDVQPMPDYRDSIMDQIPDRSECTYYSNIKSYISANPSALVGDTVTITGKVYIDYVSGCSYHVVVLGDLVIGSVGSDDSTYDFAKGLTIGSSFEQGSIYVMDQCNDLKIGDTRIPATGFQLNGYCVANQSIIYPNNVAVTGLTNFTQSVIYSEHGDIVFNFSNNVVYGLVYAPEGAVSSERYATYVNNGGVVANEIDTQKGSLYINKDDKIAFDMEMDADGGSGDDGNGKNIKLVE